MGLTLHWAGAWKLTPEQWRKVYSAAQHQQQQQHVKNLVFYGDSEHDVDDDVPPEDATSFTFDDPHNRGETFVFHRDTAKEAQFGAYARFKTPCPEMRQFFCKTYGAPYGASIKAVLTVLREAVGWSVQCTYEDEDEEGAPCCSGKYEILHFLHHVEEEPTVEEVMTYLSSSTWWASASEQDSLRKWVACQIQELWPQNKKKRKSPTRSIEADDNEHKRQKQQQQQHAATLQQMCARPVAPGMMRELSKQSEEDTQRTLLRNHLLQTGIEALQEICRPCVVVPSGHSCTAPYNLEFSDKFLLAVGGLYGHQDRAAWDLATLRAHYAPRLPSAGGDEAAWEVVDGNKKRARWPEDDLAQELCTM